MRILPKSLCLALLFTFALVITSKAQFEGTMPFMKSLPQITYYNPAFKPAYKLSIGLPLSSIFAQYTNSSFTYNDFISKKDDSTNADINSLFSALKSKNSINVNADLELLRVSLRTTPKLYLTFNVNFKSKTQVNIPKEAIALFSEGTKFFEGKNLTLSPRIESLNYLEIGLGGAYSINSKLTVGLKLKLLGGLGNVTTKTSAINLSIDENYGIATSVDGYFATSGKSYLSGSGDKNFDFLKNPKTYVRNLGYAFDVGATYKFNDRLTLGLSLLDIGSIKWKGDLYGYKWDKETANYTFKGFSIDSLLNGAVDDASRNYSKEISDTLSARFKYREGVINSYSTALPSKIYLTGVYDFGRNFSVGALFFGEYYLNTFRPSLTASVNKEFGRRLGASLSYSITSNSYTNFGLGLSLNFVPFQLYMVSDNIFGAATSLISDKNINGFLKSNKLIAVRVGINLIFGREKISEKHPSPNRKK